MSWLKTPWSIQRVVKRDVAEWQSFNRYRQRLVFSRLERELLFAGENPIRFVLSLGCLYLLTLLLYDLIPLDWVMTRLSEWKDAENLAHFTTLWSVQATIAALVYPIVIAFVTVFLQRRPASEAFVHLYILDSGALVAGLSSLALVLVMAVQYVLLPTHGTTALPVWVSLDAFWFLLNAALTTYFLFRTIDFLRPEVQAYVVRRYTVNVALPRDVVRLYASQVLAQAHTRNWIPVPSYLDEKAKDGPKVLLTRYFFREGVVQSSRKIEHPVRLYNVRLWLLRLVVWSWARRAAKWPRTADEAPFRNRNWPLLTIPITPGSVYQEDLDLARVSSGPPLAAWQKILLRLSLVFRPLDGERYGITVKSILEELEADARAAASHVDVSAFERAYEALVSLHELLLGASLVMQEDGTVGSWALLPETQYFVERDLHTGWAKSYRSVFEAALDGMERDSSPVRRLCHFIQHLDGPELQASPVAVRDHLLQFAPVFMYELGTWWTHRVEEQGILDHGPHRMVVLRPPQHRVYEEVVATFVSGWENGRTAIARVPEVAKGFSWDSAAELGQLSATHLKETARILLAAVARGDRIAAEWFADVLSKWWGSLEFEREPMALYGKTNFISLQDLSLPWETMLQTLALTAHDFRLGNEKPEDLQRSVVLAAIRNFWTDIRLLSVELLINWSAMRPDSDLDESLALEIAAGFLRGTQWRDGGSMFEPLNTMSAADYLLAKSRQYAASGEYRGGYLGQLSSFVGRIKDMQRPNMVSSRVYSFGGADDVASLQESQMILLVVLSMADWTINESLRRQVDVWLAQKFDSFEALRQCVGSWCDRFNDATDFSLRQVESLIKRTEKSHDAATGRTRAQRGVESLRDYLEQQRNALLEAEPVAPERLTQLGRFASKTAFSGESGAFPLQLFNEIVRGEVDLQDFTLTMSQVRKGELTRVEIEQRAVNEEEFWAETMERQVGAIVLRDILDKCAIRELRTPDPVSYWTALKETARDIAEHGCQPILILDNATRPEWVWQWQHAEDWRGYKRPDDLQVQRLEGRGPAYVCDFNEILVYFGPVPNGQSLVLAKETFQRLSFKAFEPDRFVDVSVVERSESKYLVDLALRLSRDVRVGYPHVVRLNYKNEGQYPSR